MAPFSVKGGDNALMGCGFRTTQIASGFKATPTRSACPDPIGRFRATCVVPTSSLVSVILLLFCGATLARPHDGFDFSQTVAKYQKTVDENPASVEAYMNLGFAYLALDAMEQATATFRQALRLDANAAEVHYWLGRINYLQGKFEEAIPLFETAIHLRPEWGDAYAELGLSYFQTHKYDEAEAVFTTAFSLKSSSKSYRYRFVPPRIFENEQKWISKVTPLSQAGIAYYLGLISFDRGIFDKAAEYYHQAICIDPQFAGAHFQVGLIYVQRKEWALAEKAFREAIRIRPQDGRAHYRLSLLYFKQGKEAEAAKEMELSGQLNDAADQLAEYRAALTRTEDRAPVLSNLGWLRLNEGKYNAAIWEYKKALWYDPNFAVAYNGLGYAYAMQGRLQEALEAQQRALQLDPQMAEAYAGLGLVRLKQAEASQTVPDYEAALSAYRQATGLNPDLPEALENLGNVALKLSHFQEAGAAYEKLLSLQPHLTWIHRALGDIFFEQKQFDRAEKAYQRAIKGAPSKALAYERLAHLYGVWGVHIDKALELAQKAVELQPDAAAYFNTLSWLYYLSKDYVGAEGAVRKALALQPGNRLYQKGLEAIQRARENEESSRK